MEKVKWVRTWWIVGAVCLAIRCAQGTTALRTGGPQLEQGAVPPAPVSRGNLPSPQEQSVAQPILAQTTPPRHFTQGEVLYIRHCAGCHGWEGQGNGPVGQVLLKKPPSLRRPEVFAQHIEAELVARILHGKDLRVSLTPEAVHDTEAEVSALLAHIRRLPTMPWKEVMAGQAVYDTLCVSCHGIYGRGDGLMAPALSPRPRDLTDPLYQKHVSDEALFRIVSDGQGAMPSTTDILSVKERRAVIAFIRLLAPGYETYDRFCAVCHGASGIPLEVTQNELFGDLLDNAAAEAKTPVFNKKYMQTHTDDYMRVRAQHMLKQHRAVMPHFGGELTAEEVRQVLGYLRSLPPLL
ncbi:MAG: c-type cytochrome [Deltaproteobacteria bacterium]|nr:c-type cytochrome [Deltaproteobacteria bacterium]